MKILIVEDDLKISAFLEKGLKEENYTVDTSYDGEDGFYLIQTNKYDLIILDIMIPNIDGITLCKKIREEGVETPIIMLTAKSSIEEKVLGLNEGANDYLTKPFSFEELLARINVQLRSGKNLNNIIKIDDLTLDRDKKLVMRANKEIEFTSKEYALVEYLMMNKEKIITEEMINQSLWNVDESTASNIVSVYMYRVRNKIDKSFDNKLIHTIRGMGYKMSENR